MDDALKLDHEFWMAQDIPILKLCSKVIIVDIGENGMDLIRNSRGCQREIAEAINAKIKIEYYEFRY